MARADVRCLRGEPGGGGGAGEHDAQSLRAVFVNAGRVGRAWLQNCGVGAKLSREVFATSRLLGKWWGLAARREFHEPDFLEPCTCFRAQFLGEIFFHTRHSYRYIDA